MEKFLYTWPGSQAKGGESERRNNGAPIFAARRDTLGCVCVLQLKLCVYVTRTYESVICIYMCVREIAVRVSERERKWMRTNNIKYKQFTCTRGGEQNGLDTRNSIRPNRVGIF